MINLWQRKKKKQNRKKTQLQQPNNLSSFERDINKIRRCCPIKWFEHNRLSHPSWPWLVDPTKTSNNLKHGRLEPFPRERKIYQILGESLNQTGGVSPSYVGRFTTPKPSLTTAKVIRDHRATNNYTFGCGYYSYRWRIRANRRHRMNSPSCSCWQWQPSLFFLLLDFFKRSRCLVVERLNNWATAMTSEPILHPYKMWWGFLLMGRQFPLISSFLSSHVLPLSYNIKQSLSTLLFDQEVSRFSKTKCIKMKRRKSESFRFPIDARSFETVSIWRRKVFFAAPTSLTLN